MVSPPDTWYSPSRERNYDHKRRSAWDQEYQTDRGYQGGQDCDYHGGREHKHKHDQRGNDRRMGITPHKDTHPKVKEMMKDYYEMNNRVFGKNICREAEIELADLRLGPVCLNKIWGKCNIQGCTTKFKRIHAKGSYARPVRVG